ncbi:MAG TPA: type II secretion system F family protein [Longimicrobiaceae bacterium]|nr:type II secretion system F family protein [Longimicrobiaceae bacterium]
MIYAVAVLVACTVALVTLLVAQLVPARPAAVGRRLAELQQVTFDPHSTARRRERQTRRERWEALLRDLGERVEKRRVDNSETRLRLVQAGFRGPNAVAMYWGIRIALPLAMGSFTAMLAPLVGTKVLLLVFWPAAIGYVLPSFYVGGRARKRMAEIRLALPDALDALVVCVEAGLGLNAALVRVSDEIAHISRLLSDELAMVNLEIRAGTPREEAMHNLAERTGVDDVRSLVAMLIQTERFGTSIAQALRVHADTLRTKRRQRAEEAAAKTAIKMLFPLVFFIFPAMFTVLLGPAFMQIGDAFMSFGK